MNFFDYAFHHVGCIGRLLRGDTAALNDMDISADGFWRSFEAIPAALPALLFTWVVESRRLQSQGVLDSLASLLARMAVLEILFWILPIVVLAFVLRALNLSHRYPQLVISRNWLSVPMSYVFVLAPLGELMTNGGQSSTAGGFLTIAALVVVLWCSFRVTRVALAVQPLVAVTFVAVEVIITYPLAVSFYAAAGLYPPV